jgi:transcription antitermination factor NusG
MSWAAVHLMSHREALALHCLRLAGYATYLPRVRERRTVRGRRVEATPALCPGYCFIAVEQQWHAARWSPGVLSIIMDGERPARVADKIIAEIRSRERNGWCDCQGRARSNPVIACASPAGFCSASMGCALACVRISASTCC